MMRKSLTWNPGSELSRHAALTLATDLKVYYADPHALWQRSSKENTNGLVREARDLLVTIPGIIETGAEKIHAEIGADTNALPHPRATRIVGWGVPRPGAARNERWLPSSTRSSPRSSTCSLTSNHIGHTRQNALGYNRSPLATPELKHVYQSPHLRIRHRVCLRTPGVFGASHHSRSSLKAVAESKPLWFRLFATTLRTDPAPRYSSTS